MGSKLSVNSSQLISGEASTIIPKTPEDVFAFVADGFWENYPRWAADVLELKSLNGSHVGLGVKGTQVRQDHNSAVESTFEIIEYDPPERFAFQGITPRYKNIYIMERSTENNSTRLTFRFELFDLSLYLRPFIKLLRVAIEDGAEATVESIRDLVVSQSSQKEWLAMRKSC